MYNPVSITISANSHGVHFVAQIYSSIEYFCPNRIKSRPIGLTSIFVELWPFSFFIFFCHRVFSQGNFVKKKYFHSSNVYIQVKRSNCFVWIRIVYCHLSKQAWNIIITIYTTKNAPSSQGFNRMIHITKIWWSSSVIAMSRWQSLHIRISIDNKLFYF